MRTEEILVDTPHKAVEKALMLNIGTSDLLVMFLKVSWGGLAILTMNHIFSLPFSGQGCTKKLPDIPQTLF